MVISDVVPVIHLRDYDDSWRVQNVVSEIAITTNWKYKPLFSSELFCRRGEQREVHQKILDKL